MSNIPSSKRYIQLEGTLDRKPISQDLLQAMGGSINYILDSVDAFGFKYQEFNANGTWTAPANATSVMLIGCGGGGGGAGVFANTAVPGGDFFVAQGGLGAQSQLNIVPVTGGQIYTILIGSGGTGGHNNATGNTGNSTFFKYGSSVLCEFKGGRGGTYVQIPPDSSGSYVTAQSISLMSVASKDSANFVQGNSNFWAWGGSAGPYGNGANGSYTFSPSTGSSAAANTGAGGGSAISSNGGSVTGGAGGSGKLFVIWF